MTLRCWERGREGDGERSLKMGGAKGSVSAAWWQLAAAAAAVVGFARSDLLGEGGGVGCFIT